MLFDTILINQNISILFMRVRYTTCESANAQITHDLNIDISCDISCETCASDP